MKSDRKSGPSSSRAGKSGRGSRPPESRAGRNDRSSRPPTPRKTSFIRKRPRDASPAAIERLLARQDWSRVHALLTENVPDAAGSLAELRAFCARVMAWNRTVSNLISKNDEGRIVGRHVVESVEHVAWLRESGCDRWLDFGSGAGFPAIPLVILGVGSRWTLVESRRIKTLFLRKTVQDMKLGDSITVVNARLEHVGPEGGRFQGFTARAAGHLDETLAHAASLVEPGGAAFLWKGSRWRAEIEDPSWQKDWTFVEHRPLADPNVALLKFLRNSE